MTTCQACLPGLPAVQARRGMVHRLESSVAMAVSYDDDNIFARILRGEIPADKVYEDERCLAFRDITPQAPTHILVIPKARIPRLADVGEDHRELLGHLLWTVKEIAQQEGFAEDGFRVVINNGARASQSVFHLHVHVLAGRDMNWPPG